MNTNTRAYLLRQARRRRVETLLARLSIVPTAMVAMMMGSLGILSLQQTGLGRWLESIEVPGFATTALPMQANSIDTASSAVERPFGICTTGARVTCVVDGDTFWLDGVKYRIADINTPEIGSPRCAAEARLGRRATERLTELLGAGPFMLRAADRDEDQYGRKLRVVERNGASVGQQLVAEGLAHEWRGRREGWC